MAEKHGSEALRDAVARAMGDQSAPAPVEQLDMLPTRFDPRIDPVDHGRQIEAARRHQRGRPPGARNKTTRDAIEFIQKTIGDPMVESARWLMHTPESLARELGCDKLEAFDRLEKIRADLRPYFYAKQAPVDHDGKPIPGLTVQIGGQGAVLIGANGEELPPWLRSQEAPRSGDQVEQNQRVIDVSPAVSHGAVSHEKE